MRYILISLAVVLFGVSYAAITKNAQVSSGEKLATMLREERDILKNQVEGLTKTVQRLKETSAGMSGTIADLKGEITDRDQLIESLRDQLKSYKASGTRTGSVRTVGSTVTLNTGRILHDAQVRDVTKDHITFQHSGGLIKVSVDLLPPELQAIYADRG